MMLVTGKVSKRKSNILTVEASHTQAKLSFVFVKYAQNIFECLSRDILTQQPLKSYDLSHITIWCHSPAAIGACRNALHKCAQTLNIPSLLLPQITTLKNWVEENSNSESRVLNETERQLLLVEAIKEFPSLFRTNNPWSIAKELLNLFDECAYAQVPLDQGMDALTQLLSQGYTSKTTKNISRESEIIYKLWTAYLEQIKQRNQVDPAIAYCKSLQTIEVNDEHCFYLVGTHYISPIEASFFERVSRYSKLDIYYPKLTLENSHTEKHPHIKYLNTTQEQSTNNTQALDIIFDKNESLLARMQLLKSTFSDNVFTNWISIFTCNSIEQHVNAVCMQAKIWLTEEQFPIGIISNDRLLSRRIRAVFENESIYARDLGGWALSTTSAATSIEVYLDAIESKFAEDQMLDVMTSPFFNHDSEDALQTLIIYFFDWLAEKRFPSIHSIDSYISYLKEFNEEQKDYPETLKSRLTDKFNHIKNSSESLAFKSHHTLHRFNEQCKNLIACLKKLGIHEGLIQDQAGKQVIAALEENHHQHLSSNTKITWADWRQWLRELLENHYFVPEQYDQRITVCGLEHIDTHHFKSVILVGVERNRLNHLNTHKTFFNENVRHELGMRTQENKNAVNYIRFRQILEKHENVLLTAEIEKNHEPQELSPWVEALELFCQQTFDESLHLHRLNEITQQFLDHKHKKLINDQTYDLNSNVSINTLPNTISATQYQTLMDCPYQFFCKYILGIRNKDNEKDFSASDFGNLVHRSLYKFHFNQDGTAKIYANGFIYEARDQLIEALVKVSEKVFMQTPFKLSAKQAWFQRWQTNIPSYVDWLINYEKNWHPKFGEIDYKINLSEETLLAGQIDRIDQDQSNFKIIDFKTGSNIPSKSMIQRGEAVQLPFYQLLFNKETNAEYLTLTQEQSVKTSAALNSDELQDLAERNRERLLLVLNNIANGSPLPANGDDSTCEYCDYQGLCRKAHWT